MHAADDGGIDDIGAAAAVTRRHKGRGKIVAQQRNVGAVRAVGDCEGAAGSVAGIARIPSPLLRAPPSRSAPAMR